MNVTLLDHTADPVSIIGSMAAICYDAKTDRDSNIKRAGHCKDKGHLSTLRFAYATINIKGISHICSHQLVRVAHSGILQESQRYVEQSNIEFVLPPSLGTLPVSLQNEWHHLLDRTESLYNNALDEGMRKEDARFILPQSCTTQLNVCMNFQAWQDFLKARTSKSAQWEIQEVAISIRDVLHGIAPEIF